MQHRQLLTQHVLFPGLFEIVHNGIKVICNGPKGTDI